jgi:predicted metalloprotease
VRLELQADCFAGIWKHATYQRGQLEQQDFEDALRAAAVVGDDFQQRRATGTITPEDWSTAPRSSASTGSRPASRRASPPPATPSAREEGPF